MEDVLFLDKLTLKIPWKNLYGEAVVASLEGLYLLVVPGASKFLGVNLHCSVDLYWVDALPISLCRMYGQRSLCKAERPQLF